LNKNINQKSDMIYPAAPWNLKGYAIQTLNLIDITRSRQVIPPELEIVSVLPGKTLGGIYLSVYESGSQLQYNELIVAAGLTRYQNQFGSWISHIYVDNEVSVAGGREIWQLPKEMADFSWQEGDVTVKQKGNSLCNLKFRQNWYHFSSWWKQKFTANAFSSLSNDLLVFNNSFSSQLSLLSGQLTIPHYSPFASLNLERPWLTVKMDNLDLMAGQPIIIGKRK
jgi:acetoacetate decarboxylase